MKNTILWLQIVALFLCVLCIPLRAYPQVAPATGTEAPETRSFPIGLDYACFRDLADTTKDYIEIYYSFNRRVLKFVAEEQSYVAIILMRLSITDELGNEVDSQMWNAGSQVDDAEKAKNVDYLIIDEVGTRLKPGNYQVTLQARDVNSMSSGEATLKFEARKFSSEKLQLSDIELASKIEPDTSVGHLNKAGKKIFPNPYRIFNHKDGMIYFYAELYNMAYAPKAKPEYSLNFSVLDVNGKKIKDFGDQTQIKPGNSAVVISGINIATLDSGEFTLQVEAKDKETGQKAYSTKKFTVFKEKSPEELVAERVKQFKQDVVYIASPSELSLFDQLNYAGKLTYMEEFWRKKDPTPETPENEFKTEHYRRISYANFHFSRTTESNDGWNTDMGRVYIRYGEPSEIERHPSTRGTKPWEQWNYHEMQGGAYFIFVDEMGYGVYRLVHSTLNGEVHDTKWEERIKSGESEE